MTKKWQKLSPISGHFSVQFTTIGSTEYHPTVPEYAALNILPYKSAIPGANLY